MDPKRRECYAIRVKLSLPAPIAYTQVEDKLCTYFQSNEGGNCDVDSVRLMGVDADGSWYKVAFVEKSGVTKMLARSDHEMVVDGIKIPLEVQGCPAPLPGTSESASSEENLQDDPQEDEPEEDEQLIVVTGLEQSTDLELLKLYFESPRKSGGDEIETIEREPKTGAISITFKDQSVSSTVAERKHKLLGATLDVKLITKKKRRPLPINTRCLFLDGIPDGCSSVHVKLFIENRASMDEEPTIQYGEKPGTAICTFSCDIPDLEHVIRNISQRKLRGASLRAEKVQHSDAILVQGVPQDLEMVELYFDNKKKSGSSGVRDVQPGPMDGQAIVYFEDWKVVQDVLTKGHHKLGGKDLRIVSYHDFLGRLSPFDAPTPHIPKPVSVEVHEPTMEFLNGKGENTMKKLLKDLAKVKANLLWPDGSQKSRAKLEPVVDESQHQSSWLNWEKEAVDVLTDFMRGYKTARVPVPQTLWKDAVDKLQKMTTACSMVPDAQLHEVILVGEQRDVDVAEATINDIIKKLQKDADYDAEQTKEDITLDVEKLQLFTLCGIKQEIEKSFPALKITVFSSPGKTGITLDGIRKTIKDVELKIRRRMDCLEKTEFKSGSTKVRFVQHVPDTIREVLGSNDIHAACSGSDDGKITIYGATTRDVRKAKAYIDNEIDEDTIAIKGQSALAVLQGHDGKRLLDSINNQKFVLAGISHEPGDRFIELAGFKRHLEETKKHILDFLKKKVIIKSTIPSNKNKIRLITTYHGQELEKVKQQHQQNLVAIQAQMSGRNRGFIIQGNEEGLDAVRKLVTSLVQAVKEKHYPVSKTGMARLFREEKGKKFLEFVEREFHCVISTDCNEESDDKAASTYNDMKTAAPGETDRDRESYSEIKRDSSGFVQSNIGSVCLQVQQGDLVRETTCAIVNSVGKGLDLQGPVSTAILKEGGELVKKQCDSLAQKHPHETVYITGTGRLLCKSIFHVVTPETPEQMKAIVAEVLQLAEKKGVPSLSFPALGTGKIGQFSVASCADIMLEAIGEFACRKKPQHLHLIRLVVFQPAMLPIFQKALENNVGKSYKQSKGILEKGVDYLTKKVTSAVYGAEGVEDDKKEEELQETVILQLSAMDMNSLMKASDRLDTFQEEEFLTEDFPDLMGLLDKMTAEHKAELIQIGRKHDVSILWTKFIRVEGCKFNVKDALLDISKMFTRIQKEETVKQKMEHPAKEVKWKYSTSSGMDYYDEEVNALIEDAFQKKKPTVTFDMEDGRAVIDFQQMQETCNRSVINVHRVDLKSAARFEPPSNWIPMMKGESKKMVKLTAGTYEYTAVETQFRASMSPFNNIIEIERIQSPVLLMQYQARRAALENRLNRTTHIEMVLYHGTDYQTSKKIITQGFKRSLCGKNATAYGNGTYFGVAASYSASPQYAKPDANGTKHIFVTNVLVGDFIRGSHGMMTPPPKPQNPAEMFDSVVDNMNSPGIYVIFHDAQAYPEYLIKFQ
ncbi:uncharacterized protein [Asterias amurensis]|uniref:uncharacterized protein n=1 Tax=Asterias amurensis TaxID=7602 RepID=UPI003AB5C384